MYNLIFEYSIPNSMTGVSLPNYSNNVFINRMLKQSKNIDI